MKVTLQPSGLVIDVEPDECILDAARRLGYNVPHSCRNGSCQVCASLLLEGRVLQHGRELDHGEIFACISEPLTDCLLHWDGVLAPGKLPVGRTTCQLIEFSNVGADVYRLRLRTPAGKMPEYYAGQYLLVERRDLSLAAFSIASAPQRERELELHIQAGDDKTRDLLYFLREQRSVRIELPFGDCHLGELPGHPLLLIAAGTGMAQMHSLVEHCLASGFKQDIHLYWGARTPHDFYDVPAWRAWQDNPQIHLHRCVSDRHPDDAWSERDGTLAEVVLEDFSEFSNMKVFACGSPAMVYATFDALVEAGMAPEQMHADAFAYAPRD